MEKILLNLANIQMLDYCREQDVNPSDSHVEKTGRGYKYSLVDNQSGEAFVALEFHKSSRPSISWLHAARKQARTTK